MMGKIHLRMFCGMLLLTSLVCLEDITAAEWINKNSQFYYTLTSFPNSMTMNETLISEEKNAPSITSCSLWCAKKEEHSLYYNYNTTMCYCNNDLDYRMDTDHPVVDGSSELAYGYVTSTIIVPYRENCLDLYNHGYRNNAIYTVETIEENFLDIFCDMDAFDRVLNVGADDCLHLLQLGFSDNGVYKIRLSNGTTVRVWCDQTGGGWTYIQRRQDGSVDFYRKWADYVNGFGDADGEYWLGLEAIYLLAEQQSSLRIDMEPFDDQTPSEVYALYDNFTLSSVSDKYRLSFGNFSGNCGDSLRLQHNQQFTTKDSDNDCDPGANCAISYRGGWWYNHCHDSNLNGFYHGGVYAAYGQGMSWRTCWGHYYSLKSCSMGVKRIL